MGKWTRPDWVKIYHDISGLMDRQMFAQTQMFDLLRFLLFYYFQSEHDPASRRGKHGHVFGRRLFLLTRRSPCSKLFWNIVANMFNIFELSLEPSNIFEHLWTLFLKAFAWHSSSKCLQPSPHGIASNDACHVVLAASSSHPCAYTCGSSGPASDLHDQIWWFQEVKSMERQTCGHLV